MQGLYNFQICELVKYLFHLLHNLSLTAHGKHNPFGENKGHVFQLNHRNHEFLKREFTSVGIMGSWKLARTLFSFSPELEKYKINCLH